MHDRFVELCPHCRHAQRLGPHRFFCTTCGHRLHGDDGRPLATRPRSGDQIALAFRRQAAARATAAAARPCPWCRAPLRPALRFCTACGCEVASAIAATPPLGDSRDAAARVEYARQGAGDVPRHAGADEDRAGFAV